MSSRPRVVALGLACLFVFVFPFRAQASGSWQYSITEAETPVMVDTARTTAEIDTEKQEIRLPKQPAANVVSFWPDGQYDYVVLTATGVKHFSFDGAHMVENDIVSVPGLPSPLALAAPAPYPDVVVATKESIRHYSFTGNGMAENPALAVAGLSNVVSVGSLASGDLAILAGEAVKRYSFDGNALTEVPTLEPAVSFNNPLALAVAGNGYDLAVLEKDRVRYFSFDGVGMTENPALSVTGLASPKAFAVDGGKEIAVVDGTSVKHYSFDGSQMVYNAALSVTAGLTAPSAVALRPGSPDRIIVDGDKVRYFAFDGSGLVENPALSVQVSDIVKGDSYAATAEAVSVPKDPGAEATHVRVRASVDVPNGTSVTWSVSADGGATWVLSWRAVGAVDRAVVETTPDNGATWVPLDGGLAACSPQAARTELWTQVAPGRQVVWKAVLATSDPKVTPRVYVAQVGQPAVVWEANAKPNPPVLHPLPGWYYTTTPTFEWDFSDPDNGDVQGAFEVVVERLDDGALVYDSGMVVSSEGRFRLPTSTTPEEPGPLWQSGTYRFTLKVRVWDAAGVPSDWCVAEEFRVLAFERPRVAKIVSPPAGQAAPDPSSPETHILVTEGMTADELPRVKAGAEVTLLVDSVGPVVETVAVFPYGDKTAQMGGTPLAERPMGAPVNRWTIRFWTEANLQEVPTGTIVGMNLTGPGTEGGTTEFKVPPYAAGIVRTEGSIYQDWFVVLQGALRE